MLKIAKEENQYRVELFQVNRFNTLFSALVKQQLEELVEEPGVTVAFDLNGIRFIDSSGFEVLKEITGYASRNGSEFKLCNVTPEVRELIMLLELEAELAFCTCKKSVEKIQLVLE